MPEPETEKAVYEALVAVSSEDEWRLTDLAARANVSTDGYGIQVCERCLNRLEAKGRVEWDDGTWRPVGE